MTEPRGYVISKQALKSEIARLKNVKINRDCVMHNSHDVYGIVLGNCVVRLYFSGHNHDVLIRINKRKAAKISLFCKTIGLPKEDTKLLKAYRQDEKIFWSLALNSDHVRLISREDHVEFSSIPSQMQNSAKAEMRYGEAILNCIFFLDAKDKQFYLTGTDFTSTMSAANNKLCFVVYRHVLGQDKFVSQLKSQLNICEEPLASKKRENSAQIEQQTYLDQYAPIYGTPIGYGDQQIYPPLTNLSYFYYHPTQGYYPYYTPVIPQVESQSGSTWNHYD